MKKFILLAILLLGASSISALAQREVVTSNYHRSGLSMVTVVRGDSYDTVTSEQVADYNPGDKFDINNLATKTIKISGSRENQIPKEKVVEAVNAQPFGKEILSCLFNRDKNGMMDDKTIRYRGNYDAKDQDVINARASYIGADALGDMGEELVDKNYIAVFDFYNMGKETDAKGKDTYYTLAEGYLFKIDLKDLTLDEFFKQCWIYEDDSAAVKAQKRKAFDNLDIVMTPVSSGSTMGQSSSQAVAIENAISTMFVSFEFGTTDWAVASTITGTKPLRAKIGTKENLANGERFRAYSYREDRNGNLISVPRGYLRATTVADNTGMSEGNSQPSEFIQVSDLTSIENGWTIRREKDWRLGVSLGYGGGFRGNSVRLGVDYLAWARTNGWTSYILTDFTADFRGGGNVTNVYFALGYGHAMRLMHVLEVMPYLTIGDDYMGPTGGGGDNESNFQFLRRSGFVFEPGVKASVNIMYPLQAFAKIYYDALLYPHSTSNDSYDYYNFMYFGHHSHAGMQVGLKWTF